MMHFRCLLLAKIVSIYAFWTNSKSGEDLKEQAEWWLVALKSASVHSPIVLPDQRVPSNALEGYTDAAGGTISHVGAGLGGLVDCHKSNGSSYIMDELDVPQPTYMATSDPNLSKLSSYLTSSS